MKGYFVSSENEAYFKSDEFSRVLQFLQKNPKKSRLKEVKNKLFIIFDNMLFGPNVNISLANKTLTYIIL